jgi:lauroyl/myristoyl acyltransferase
MSRVRRAVRVLAAGILGATHRSPHFALRGADLLAPAARPFRRVPPAADLHELFPQLTPEQVHALRTHVLRTFVRSEVLAMWLRRRGRAAVRSILASTVPPALPAGPLIAGTFHMGPLHALGAALESLPTPLLALRISRHARDAAANEQHRAAKFYEAATWLRSGGVVLMALDPQHATRIPVPFFGRTLGLARGAFALSRMTGAPIVPIVARWRGTRVEVVAGQPLEGGDERELAAAAARWLEAHLRAFPDEISLRILDLMER